MATFLTRLWVTTHQTKFLLQSPWLRIPNFRRGRSELASLWNTLKGLLFWSNLRARMKPQTTWPTIQMKRRLVTQTRSSTISSSLTVIHCRKGYSPISEIDHRDHPSKVSTISRFQRLDTASRAGSWRTGPV